MRRLTQKGFSLIELMVGMAVATIVTLGVSSIFVFTVEQFNLMVEQNAAEESLLQAAYFTRLYFSQAVSTTGFSTPGTTAFYSDDASTVDPYAGSQIDCRTGTPVMNQITAEAPATPANTYQGNRNAQLVAAFRRETGDITNGVSDFKMTGIYIRNPDFTAGAAAPVSGAVMFASGTNDPNTVKFGTAQFSAITIDRLVSYDLSCQLSPQVAAGGAPVQTVTAVITSRYFKRLDKTRWRYSKNTNAGAVDSYRDVSMTVTVGLRNNNLGQSLTGNATQRELLHGGIYYLRFNAPPPSNF